MTTTTSVYLITGFLGSGKTTLLNRIVKGFPKERKLMILMNEFGDIGLDGALVEGDDLDIMEISKGSIFCVCVKTDFIKGLMNIAQNLQPDVLIIEATGVANPSDLKRDLALSIFQNRFELKEQLCMIDAVHFESAYDTFTSVEKQIESATVFIINKVDKADAGQIADVKKIIRRHHPDPVIIETQYADIPLAKFLPHAESVEKENMAAVSEQELDVFIDELMADPGNSMTPPDQLESCTVHWKGTTLDELEKAADAIPRSVVRAKGIVTVGDELYLLNHVMGSCSIEKINLQKQLSVILNKVVFIAAPTVIHQLGSHLKSTALSHFNLPLPGLM